MPAKKVHYFERKLLAFCHVEKAAGTSLIHILRRIYFLRYAAVRPMISAAVDNFTARDLKVALRINPFLAAFGGHSVLPHGDLMDVPYPLNFITQVRPPVQRAASQYKFWLTRMSVKTSWQEFLKHPMSRNLQVRKFAGSENLDLAKENLCKHFMLVGTVDQFDTFLVLLASKLQLPLSVFTYEVRNTDRSEGSIELPNAFFDGLRERNQLDQQLYDWVRDELLPTYIAQYPGCFAADLERFRKLAHAPHRAQLLIDFVYRNTYLKPISGILRVAHGLPYHGSYART